MQRGKVLCAKTNAYTIALVLWASAAFLAVSGCGPKPVSKEEGDAMMAKFKGGAPTAADKAGDAKDRDAALAYRKAHPDQFPTPKYNVPQGPAAPVGSGPVGGTQ